MIIDFSGGWALQTFLGGLVGGMSFGPINLLVLSLYASGKRYRGIAFSVGALVGDFLIICTHGFLISMLSKVIPSQFLIFLGAIILVMFGLWKFPRKLQSDHGGIDVTFSNYHRWFLAAVVITYFNPFGVLVWGAITSTSLVTSLGLTAILLTILGSAVWFLAFNLLLYFGSRWISTTVRLTVERVATIAIIVVGIFGAALAVWSNG